MQLIRRWRCFPGAFLVASLVIVGSTSQAGLITDLSSQFQLASSESPSAEPQVTEGDFFHSETTAFANQSWHGTDAPWIQIVQSVDETGHASNFGAMLVGDSPNASKAGRRGNPGGGGGGGGGSGGGAGGASALNGVAQNPTSSGGVPTSVTIPTVPLASAPAEVPSSGPAALAVAAVPTQEAASIPEQAPDEASIAETPFPESYVAIPPATPFQEPDLVSESPVSPPSDPGILTGTEPTAPSNPGRAENAFVIPALYENPEPGSMLLMAIGAGALLMIRRATRSGV